jgi:pimeloyl-ACP methyl ester carboxylesterase
VPLHGPVGGDALVPFEQAVGEGDLDHALTLGLRLKLQKTRSTRFSRPTVVRARDNDPTWAREIRAMDAFGDDLQRFAALQAPTLLVIGQLSAPWLTDTSRHLQHAIPASRLVEICGHAHDAFLTGPETMAEAILLFAKPTA